MARELKPASAALDLGLDTWQALVGEVTERAPLPDSYDHGPHHWRLVAWVGAELIDKTPEADPLVVLLFALFHDCQRENEHGDRRHGSRGGVLARELLAGRPEILGSDQLEVLVDACERHTGAKATSDPTLGVCWDSDRLNLWRVGIQPHPFGLSTLAAKDPEMIAWADLLQFQDFTWEEVGSRYGLGGKH